MNIKAETV